MLLEVSDSQLVLVDYQLRLMPAIHDGPLVLANALKLAQAAQILRVPVFGTEQNPERLGTNDEALRALCQRTLAKMSFSAVEVGLVDCLRPPARPVGGNARSLPKHLQKPQAAHERNTVVIAGCEAHVCLLQTALELTEQEIDVWVVTDACGSRTERNRDAAFDRLAGAGAELVTTEMVLFEWLRTAEHPAFRELQALIK
ncbi:isochorismatase [Hydrogenophaga crassostreae]|uniref:Isochorismatase n=1 Tax=Hydrogenophaga crassostreae TaxID=1763535 RepID=A0A167IE39_9BURK|nr:isochorismatase family protein [Hydrogenophaga crassostreae]AOW13251.1 isochorismatase [Hydrogenophaga crassostreae]OAD42602.1 isochorismatase [Hydrogenophaga crassostreae]